MSRMPLLSDDGFITHVTLIYNPLDWRPVCQAQGDHFKRLHQLSFRLLSFFLTIKLLPENDSRLLTLQFLKKMKSNVPQKVLPHVIRTPRNGRGLYPAYMLHKVIRSWRTGYIMSFPSSTNATPETIGYLLIESKRGKRTPSDDSIIKHSHTKCWSLVNQIRQSENRWKNVPRQCWPCGLRPWCWVYLARRQPAHS